MFVVAADSLWAESVAGVGDWSIIFIIRIILGQTHLPLHLRVCESLKKGIKEQDTPSQAYLCMIKYCPFSKGSFIDRKKYGIIQNFEG